MTEPTVSPTDVPDGDITDVPTPTITVEPTSEATNEVTFELTGQPYEYSLNEIRVSQGDLVTIEFTSTDGFHDFNIDELGVASDRVNTGNTTTVQFTADQVGTFNFYCSVSNHRAQGMEGVFIVE